MAAAKKLKGRAKKGEVRNPRGRPKKSKEETLHDKLKNRNRKKVKEIAPDVSRSDLGRAARKYMSVNDQDICLTDAQPSKKMEPYKKFCANLAYKMAQGDIVAANTLKEWGFGKEKKEIVVEEKFDNNVLGLLKALDKKLD